MQTRDQGDSSLHRETLQGIKERVHHRAVEVLTDSGWRIQDKGREEDRILSATSRLTHTRLVYGVGAVDEKLGAVVDEMREEFGLGPGGKVALLRGQRQRDAHRRVKRTLEDKGHQVHEVEEVHPARGRLDRVSQDDRVKQADFMVAVGGGGLVDAAKKTASVRYQLERKAAPLVFVNTCPGAGNDINEWAVVTDENTGTKVSGQYAFPHTTLIDPVCFAELSSRQMFFSGMDALVQSFEGAASTGAKPETTAGSRIGAGLLRDFMKASLAAGRTPQQRLYPRAMAALGATVAGASMSQAGLGLTHGIGNQVSEVPHGLVVAMVFPQALRYSVDCSGLARKRYGDLFADVLPYDRMDELPELLVDYIWTGKGIRGEQDEGLNGIACVNHEEVSFLEGFARALGLYLEAGDPDKHLARRIEVLADQALHNVNTKTDPGYRADTLGKEDILMILKRSIDCLVGVHRRESA